ncbi:MAG: NUDIX domain-containing protein [Parcubacteria group bacterium]|nr:NUDIX domain-containing protein [Parcubacteria group bacterium]
MKKSQRDLYYVAVKAFMRKGDLLLITKDRFGHWDIPGGRIQKHEFKTPLEAVLKRKIKEELGSRIRCRIGKPIILMRHVRKENTIPGQSKVRIFAVGYDVKFLSGAVSLGKSHVEYRWVPLKSLRPEKYFKGGWLEGAREYLGSKNQGLA